MDTRLTKNVIGAIVITVASAACGTPAIDAGTGEPTNGRALEAQTARFEALADWYGLAADDDHEALRFAQRVESDHLRATLTPAGVDWHEVDRFRQRVQSDALRR